MHAIALRRFMLIAACVASAPALAGVGGTSAGVTSNIPGQSTDPSAEVQSQSAGFVQQNQQLQNGSAPNGTAPNGIAIPINTSGAAAGQGNAASSAADGNAKLKPGDPAAVNAQPAAPPTPPPPPPTYVSVVKHVTPQTPDADSAAKPVAAVPAAVIPAAPTPVSAAKEKTEPSPAAQVPVPVIAARAEANLARAKAADANLAKNAIPEHAAAAPAVTGGRGEAPDGFAFYTGLGITILLLAVALATYLRAQRDEAAIRPPR